MGQRFADFSQIKEYFSKIKAKFAKKKGVYPELIAGNLTDSKASPVAREFTFDTSCGDASISYDGTATIKKIKGNTVVHNQMVSDIGGDYHVDASASTSSGQTFADRPNNSKGTTSYFPYGETDRLSIKSVNETIEKVYGHSYVWNQLFYDNNVIVLNDCSVVGTKVTITTAVNNKTLLQLNRLKASHKYLFNSTFDYNTYGVGKIRVYGTSSILYSINGIFTADINRASILTISNNHIIPIGYSFDVYCIDLTQIFGSGNEPTSVEDPRIQWLIQHASKHPEYNTGEMVNAEDFTYSSSGINQWDEQWELGDISSQTGLPVISSSSIRSKNYIPCFANTDYYIKAPTTSSITSTARVYLYFYDVSKNFIGYTLYGFTPNVIKKTPENCAFMKFIWQGTTYNHDIQICLHYTDTEVENTYHPYVAPSTKEIKFYGGVGRSAGSVCDEVDYVAKKRIKRVGSYTFAGVDSWSFKSTGIVGDTYSLYLSSYGLSNNASLSIMSNGQLSNDNAYSGNKLGYFLDNNRLVVSVPIGENPRNYYKNGDVFVYELATPVEEDIPQVEQNNILPCNDYGIESKSDGVVCGMKVKYQGTHYNIPLLSSHKYMFRDKSASVESIITSQSTITVDAEADGTGDNLIDLTREFGAGNEPATVTDLYHILPMYRNAIPYNTGEIVNYHGNGIVTIGFNQWDEEWEEGIWDVNSGVPLPSTTRLRSKNAYKVIPNTTYYVKGSARFIYFDKNMNFLSITRDRGYYTNALVSMPNDCHYVKFNFASDYGTTYNHDICINLSWSGYRNGEYEPYWKKTLDLSPVQRIQKHAIKSYIVGSIYSVGWLSLTEGGASLTPEIGKLYKIATQGDLYNNIYKWTGSAYTLASDEEKLLFPDGLCSAGNIYDEVTSTGTIRRVYKVDLGTLDWVKVTTGNEVFRTIIANIIIGQTSNNLYCSKYATSATIGRDNLTNKEICQNSYQNVTISDVCIKDTSYADATSFKASLNGVYLIYGLATPEVVTFDDNADTGSANQTSPLDLSYPVADFGTEESIPENTSIVPVNAPFKGDIAYSSDFTRQLATMSKTYAQKESLDQLLVLLGKNNEIETYIDINGNLNFRHK